MQLESSGDDGNGKAQVVDIIPKRFKELKFGVQCATFNLNTIHASKAYYDSGRTKTLSIKPLSRSRIACSMMWRKTEHLSKMGPWIQDWWGFLDRELRELKLMRIIVRASPENEQVAKPASKRWRSAMVISDIFGWHFQLSISGI